MTRKVILHVGTPKTGTSYLQDVLFKNKRLLGEHGILYAADRFDAHFLAALDLMRLPWGGLEREAVGSWDRLAEQVRGWGGETAIISHEILAGASRSQVGRALTSLGHQRDGSGVEVHLVLSVRDLVRQIPAEWQENVKHRSGMSYGRFLARVTDPHRNSRIASWFWSVQEVPEILDRWGADLPPERIHLVTVPSPGGAPDLLWKRFSQAFGLEGIDLVLEDERVNPSLGVPETALIRRINRSANRVLEPADYRPLVRELLAHQTLSRRVLSPRLALPPEQVPWVQEREAAFVDGDRAPRLRRRRRPRRPSGQPVAAPVRRPRPAAGTRRRRGRGRRHQGAAARERPDARRGGPAPGGARRDPSRAVGGPTCGRRTGCARRP